MSGLEERVRAGEPINKIHSVASFFLSRIDTKVDNPIERRLQTIGTESIGEEARLNVFKGKVAIANAKIAYQKYQEIVESDRWQNLAKKDANIQRLLWASTSVKNPAYSDLMYVNELVAPNTVNTLVPTTIEACADRCEIRANSIESKIKQAYRLINSLQDWDIQIDLEQVMAELLEEGIEQFVEPFQLLMKSLENKFERLSLA